MASRMLSANSLSGARTCWFCATYFVHDPIFMMIYAALWDMCVCVYVCVCVVFSSKKLTSISSLIIVKFLLGSSSINISFSHIMLNVIQILWFLTLLSLS